MEAHRPPVKDFLRIEDGSALNLGAKAEFREPGRPGISDLPSCRLAVTSCTLEPIEDTMPIPVTTTRLIPLSP